MGRFVWDGMASALGAFLVVFATPASAGVISVNLGTGSPPSTLGGHDMVSFVDTGVLGEWVTEVAAPPSATASGPIEFSSPLEHSRVGKGWETWSHSYKGDVYWFDELIEGSRLTVMLPQGTQAFYMYLEPDFYGTASFGVSSGSASTLMDVSGDGGASGIGFYSDDPGQDLLSITIEKLSADFSNGFGVGEFGINGVTGVPDGSSGVTIGLVTLLGFWGLGRQMRRWE